MDLTGVLSNKTKSYVSGSRGDISHIYKIIITEQ